MKTIAHLNPETKKEQSILEHLTQTAQLSSKFAEAFNSADAGYLCGILHDIGKYSHKFQLRIRGSNERVDHSTAGAQVALQKYNNAPASFCIAGHHGGLPDGGNRMTATPDDSTFLGKMERKVGEDIEDFSAYETEIEASEADIPAHFRSDIQSQFFFTRMLYSCLVDADYLDTEEFMSEKSKLRGGYETLQQLALRLDKHISKWWDPKEEINQKRCEILQALKSAGDNKKGVFSLTVPTGGGKTVSSMAFALQHALKHEMNRIIYVIPYISIIEQTQEVFKKIFGTDNVVAHYSNIDYKVNEDGSI
ncbi:MAG: CRISPR-associated endonuclease Cas3'', partial [Clostridiales bacterium]|nr:CRISPR-associated endonuclease Cas3'' [Clostridiales bacterium]